MYIARILFPVKVLGPGNRIGIWFDGCNHKCKGCSNPELWEQQDIYKTDKNIVMDLIKPIVEKGTIDGFTLTGGDPFLQPEALEELLPLLTDISSDILCYTGFNYEELKDSYGHILKNIAVLIDGKYIEERNNGQVLRGSDNQRIIVLREEFKEKYDDYLSTAKNEIQNFRTRETIISVGIHDRNYNDDLKRITNTMGLVETY